MSHREQFKKEEDFSGDEPTFLPMYNIWLESQLTEAQKIIEEQKQTGFWVRSCARQSKEIKSLKKELAEARELIEKQKKVLDKINYHIADSAYKDKGHFCEHKNKVMAIGDMIKALPTKKGDE